MVALDGGGRVRWQGVGAGDGHGDESLVVVWLGWSACLVYIAGALEDVVGPRSISPLLEPAGDGPVVLEGVVEARPDLCFYQPIVDSLLGVVPLGPVPAQLPVSFFQVFFVEGRLSEVVDVGLDADIVEVPEFYVDQGTKGELSTYRSPKSRGCQTLPLGLHSPPSGATVHPSRTRAGSSPVSLSRVMPRRLFP